jgi:hypothetical protein
MNRKKSLAALFVVSLVATMAVVYLVTSSSPVRPPASTEEAASDQAGESTLAAARREPRGATPRSEDEQEELEQRLVLMLRHLYGDRISSTGVQILMAQVRIQVQTLFPLDWQQRFPRILEAAFPGFSAKILATLANVDAFDRWMAANEAMLAGLTPEEREKTLLAKKQELFGVAAVEELEAETRESQKRETAMHDTIRSLEESDDTTLDQKLDVYMDELKKNFGDGPNAIALENSSALAHAFFGLESVSRQLAALDPKARQEKINDIRRELGYDDEQIAALEEDDREKEARWQTGYSYMNERRALEGRYSGADLDQQLAALRQRYFGEESHTIGLEEKDGFFRFERPRFYGRN